MKKLIKKPKVNSITKDINWSVIFEKIILKQYFSHNELILLSSLDTRIRNYYRPLILTQFSIYNPTNKRGKVIGEVDEDAVLKTLDSEIKPFSKNITSVNIGCTLKNIDISFFFGHLHHIQSLKVYNIKLGIHSLNILLSRLNCLKHLTLEDMSFLYTQDFEEEEVMLKLPSSVITLFISGGNIGQVMGEVYQEYSAAYHHFDYNSFHPNLNSIELFDSDQYRFESLEIIRLLANNPNLTSIHINFSNFNQTNLEAIKVSKITKLKFESHFSSRFENDLSQLSNIQLDSIKEIQFIWTHDTNTTYWTKFIKLSKAFPMLKSLSIYYNGLNEKKLSKLLNNFSNLKKLSIYNANNVKNIKLCIENSSIEHLTLKYVHLLKLDHNSFNKWYNLKSIKVNLNYTKMDEKDVDEYLEGFSNWKFTKYTTSSQSSIIYLFKV